MCRCSLLSGHLEIKKTKFRVTRNLYWCELREDFRIFVILFETCAFNKPPTHKQLAPIGSMFFEEPWDCVATDFSTEPLIKMIKVFIADAHDGWDLNLS